MKTSELKEVDGYKARLIAFDELTSNFGYEKITIGTPPFSSNGETQGWVYNNNYAYWTMSSYNDSTFMVWDINYYGNLSYGKVYSGDFVSSLGVVRPVINLKKSAIQ